MKTFTKMALLGLIAAAAPVQAADLVTLYSFAKTGSGGYYPSGGLAFDAAGNLYGTAASGGSGGGGTVFRLSNSATGYASSITTLASFSTSGVGPRTPQYSAVVVDAAGNIFGTTTGGGSPGGGTVFKIAAGTNALTTLSSFGSASGSTPRGPIVMDAGGNIFGTTVNGGSQGYGTVWEAPFSTKAVTPATTPTALANFGTAAAPGANSTSGLVADAAGNLYGATGGLGTTDFGTIFKIAFDTHQYTTLATLSSTTGQAQNPIGALAVDAAGNVYGVSSRGGTMNAGSIFTVKAGSGTVTTLASFDPATTGASPFAGLIVDAVGNLFGTTYTGTGTAAGGAVFELAAGSSTINPLVTFNLGSGNSIGRLREDADGNLYGTTASGGANGVGTIFKVTNTGYVAVAAAVPEAGTWGMMIVGMGAVGSAMRRRNPGRRAARAA